MANPFLPLWEYIPDGESHVFGDRVYLYGSHDCAASYRFCDDKLKVWSAPLSDLNHWMCHGISFSTRDTNG
ncbi:MAG: xylan 1,4-beta-xylosidase, partial [Oscillospiraceae bacterium]|nr:xylan 1,4-beta-xylosidase [Oscillospiraceae bacterium]